MVENTRYRDQLAEVFKECTSLLSGLNGLKTFDEYSIQKLVVAGDSCLQPKNAAIYVAPPMRFKVKFGLVGGVNLNYLSLAGPAVIVAGDLSAFHFGSKVNGVAGLFLDLVVPGCENRWVIHNELSYFKVNLNSATMAAFGTGKAWIEVKGSYMSLTNTLQYWFQGKRHNSYLEFGFSNAISSDIAPQIKYYDPNLVNQNLQSRSVVAARGYQQFLNLGAGLSLGKFGLAYRFSIGNGFSKESFVGSTTYNNNFLLSYLLAGKVSG